MSIYKKLNEFKKNVGTVRKDSTNPHYKNKYATIESVLDTIEDPLLNAGLGFYQSVKDMNLETVVYDAESGETLTSVVPLIIGKQDMQQLGSAITYARRYGLVSMFGLEQEDDDGNKAVKKPELSKLINDEQITQLKDLILVAKADLNKFLSAFKIAKLEDMPLANYQTAINSLNKKIDDNKAK